MTSTVTQTAMSEAVIKDMTPIGMFLQADFIVQAVMISLLLASMWCWAVIIEKSYRLKSVRRRGQKFQEALWSSEDLDKAYSRAEKREDHAISRIFLAGMREWYKSRGHISSEAARTSLKERIWQTMSVAKNREIDDLESHLGFLATCGSVAPFVGLFGTVWGIMRSFTAVASVQNTSLAVVAPGIAEALFATAIGLFAAIPAVIFYNRFISQLSRINGMMDDFISEFSVFMSRQLDNHGVLKAAA